MKTKAQLKYSLKWLEVDLKNAKTKSDIAKIEKKIKDTNEKIAKLEAKKKGGRTRRSTRRN